MANRGGGCSTSSAVIIVAVEVDEDGGGRVVAVVRKPKAEPWMSAGRVRVSESEEEEVNGRSRGGRDE